MRVEIRVFLKDVEDCSTVFWVEEWGDFDLRVKVTAYDEAFDGRITA